jgi:hypothetical protein
VPGAPETLKTIVIVDAAVHIFRYFNIVPERPAACYLPDGAKFVPNKEKCVEA